MCLVKYQCSKNYHAEGVCEANCHVKLISTKLVENILVLFFVIDNKMFTAAILEISTVRQGWTVRDREVRLT